MNSLSLSWRDRIGAVLHDNRLIIAAELLVATILQALHVLRIIPTAVIFLFIIGWLSLWLRKSGWRQLGMSRPPSWLRTIPIGTTVGVVFQFVALWLVEPLLQQLTNEPLDLTQFEPVRANVSLLLISLIISWTLAAFGEEMVHRGYLLNRFADLFGHNRAGWAVGLIGSSAFFALGHAYQGVTGILGEFLFACVMAGLYLSGRRNLWLPLIAHGIYNTVGLVLIFLGLYP
jgi:hypothetical protein